MEVRAQVNFIEGNKFKATFPLSGVELYIDKKKENYASVGANPLELFLSSLCSCMGIFARMYLIKQGIDFKELSIEADSRLSENPPLRLVNTKINIYTDAELGDRKDAFLRTVKNCPIHNTILHSSQDVDIELK